MRHGTIGLACLLLLGLLGCTQDRPVVSLETARRITATFAADGFVAPPRTVNDILALLDQEQPDPLRVAQDRLIADGAPPPGLAPAEMALFFQTRGMAAAALGRTRQQIDDLTRAYELAVAAPGRVDLSRLMQQLASVNMRAGNRAEAIRYRKLQQAEHESSQSQQGRLFGPYAGLIGTLADQGEMDEARAYLSRMSVLLSSAHSWKRGAAYIENGAKWEALYLSAQAILAEKSGALAETERLRRAEVAAFDAIVTAPDEDSQRFRLNRDLALRNLSRVLSRRGRPVEAEIEARRALINQLHEHGRFAPETAEMLLSLTDIVAQQGRWADAETLARATIDIYHQTGHGPGSWSLAQARANLGMVLVMADRPAAGLETFRSLAADIGGDRALSRRMLGGNLYYADALLAGGQAGEAARILRTVVQVRTTRLGPDHPDTAEARGLLGAALADSGDPQGAMEAFRLALPALLQPAESNGMDEIEDGSIGRARRTRLVLESFIALRADSGDDTPETLAETFRAADSARSQTVQRSLAASAARASTLDPEMADLIRREQDTAQQLNAHRAMLADQLSAAPGQRDEALVTHLHAQVESLQAARLALRLEIDRRFPAYARLRSPPPAGLAEVQAALHDGEALISILVGRRRSFVWAVPKSGRPAFAAVPLGQDEVAAMVARLRAPMEAQISELGQLPAYDLALAHRAFTAFLAPVEAGWGDARSLLVVADRTLGQLPLSILVTEPATLAPEAEGQALLSAYRAVPWLVRRAAVTQLPSAASLVALRHLPPGPAERRPFIGFGDPWFTPAQAEQGRRDLITRHIGSAPAEAGLVSRGIAPARRIATRALARRALPGTRGMDTARLSSLPRLPETADEVISVALALHADPVRDVFLGDLTTESRILSMPLADRKVVMFATHGLIPGDIDGLSQPALAMSNPAITQAGGTGLLTMDNVLGLKLDADWVVLSACNTASSDGSGAEAISGLGRAFFYAGTRALLVTHWSVESGSAALITTGLFRRAAETPGLSRAEALRRTMLSLIDGPGAIDPDSMMVMFSYAHPIFWAPYALVGDGG